MSAKKRKNLEDIYYPVPMEFNPINAYRPQSNQEVVRKIVQGSVRVAYGLKKSKNNGTTVVIT